MGFQPSPLQTTFGLRVWTRHIGVAAEAIWGPYGAICGHMGVSALMGSQRQWVKLAVALSVLTLELKDKIYNISTSKEGMQAIAGLVAAIGTAGVIAQTLKHYSSINQ